MAPNYLSITQKNSKERTAHLLYKLQVSMQNTTVITEDKWFQIFIVPLIFMLQMVNQDLFIAREGAINISVRKGHEGCSCGSQWSGPLITSPMLPSSSELICSDLWPCCQFACKLFKWSTSLKLDENIQLELVL